MLNVREPDSNSEPVIWADPTKGKAGVPGAYDAVKAYDDDTALDEEVAKEALSTVPEPVAEFKVYPVANEAVLAKDALSTVPEPVAEFNVYPIAKDAVKAYDEDTALDAVPSKFGAVMLLVTVKDPVIIASPFTSSFAFGDVVPIPTW